MGHTQTFTYIGPTYGIYTDIYLHRTYIWEYRYTYIGPNIRDIYLHRTYILDI
jgi:hypothetical protein